jgi:hypothetical protein
VGKFAFWKMTLNPNYFASKLGFIFINFYYLQIYLLKDFSQKIFIKELRGMAELANLSVVFLRDAGSYLSIDKIFFDSVCVWVEFKFLGR